MSRVNILSLFLILYMILSLSAQVKETEAGNLPLSQAWLMMQENDYELKTLMLDREAKFREVQSLEQLIPGISAGLGLSRGAPLVSYLRGSPSDENEVDRWAVRGALDFKLSLNTGIPLEERIELIELELLDLHIARIVKRKQAELALLYYEIITGDKNIELLKDAWLKNNDRLADIELQFEQGLISELELLTARIYAAGDLPELEKSRIDQEKRWNTLREYIQKNDSLPIKLISSMTDDFMNIPEVEILKKGLRGNEDYIAAGLEVILAEMERKLSRRDLHGPELGISLGWTSQVDPAFNSQSWTSDNWEDNLNLSFSLSVPIDNHIKGSSGYLELKENEDLIQKAEWNREHVLNQLEGRLKSLLLDIKLSRVNIELNELNSTLQEENYIKVRENYNNGRVSLSVLDESRQEHQNSIFHLESEKLNLISLIIDLAELTDFTSFFSL